MSDVAFDLGVNTRQFQAELRTAQNQLATAVRVMDTASRTHIGRTDQRFQDLIETTEDLQDAEKGAGEQAKDTAKEIDSPKIQAAAGKWAQLLGVVANAAATYLGARAAAAHLQREQSSLIDSAIKTAAAYVSLRGAIRSTRDLLAISSEFQQQRQTLEALFQSAAAGRLAFQWIDEFNGKLPGFTDAFIALKNFGLNPMDGSLRSINDAAAQFGRDSGALSRIVLQLGQAWAGGALRLEEINSLIDNGIPIWELLTQVTGKTVREIRELSSAGELGRDVIRDLIEAMGGQAAGAAQRRMAGYTGQIKNLTSEAKRFVDTIGQQGLLAAAERELAKIFGLLGELKASGQLDAIAKEIAGSLSRILQAAGTLIRSFFQSLARLAETGELRVIAEGIASGIEKLAFAIQRTIPGLRILTPLAIRFFEALLILKLTAFATGLSLAAAAAVRLGFYLARIGIAGIRAGFLGASAAVLRFAAVIPGLSAVLGFLQARIVGILALTGVFGLFFVGLAIGAERAIRKNAELARQLEESNRKTQTFMTTTEQLSAAIEELDKLGFGELASQATKTALAFQNGFISAEQAIQDVGSALITARNLSEELQRRQETLAAAQAALAQAQAQAATAAAREALQAKIQTDQEELQNTQAKLREIERAEREAAKRIIDIRQALARVDRETQQEVADIRRQGLSERRQQAQLEREAGIALARATLETFKARAAASEEAKQAALDEAKALQDRARALIGQVDNEKAAISLTEELGRARKLSLQEQLRLQEQIKARAGEEKKAVETAIKTAEERIAALKKELDALGKTDVTIPLQADVEQAKSALIDIEKRIRALAAGVTIPVRVQQSEAAAALPGFARGGWLPGYGGGDRRLILAEDGEFMVNKARARLFAPLLEAINWGSVAQVKSLFMQAATIPRIRVPAMPKAATIPGYATGGAIGAQGRGRQDLVTIELKLPRSTHRVLGSREEASRIVDAFTRLSRGLPA